MEKDPDRSPGEARGQMPPSQGTRRQGGPWGSLTTCHLVKLFVSVFTGLPETLGPQARASWACRLTGWVL